MDFSALLQLYLLLHLANTYLLQITACVILISKRKSFTVILGALGYRASIEKSHNGGVRGGLFFAVTERLWLLFVGLEVPLGGLIVVGFIFFDLGNRFVMQNDCATFL